MIEPYKGRRMDPGRRVQVYRNLNRPDGPWYSIRQNGRVVAHAREVALSQCQFKVNLKGRARALRTGQKNVHAFVEGYVVHRIMSAVSCASAPGRYLLQETPTFQAFVDGAWKPVLVAAQAHLGGRGLTVFWLKR